MRIDSLRVRNFKGFDDREFHFNPQFNLLIGDNAAGKTSVLEALAVAVGSWFLGMRGFEKSPGIKARQVRTVSYRHVESYTFERQFPASIESTGLVMGNGATWMRELQREGGRTTTDKASAVSEAASQAEKQVRAGAPVTLPLICAYGTERLWFEEVHYRKERNSDGELPSRLDGYRDCFRFTIQETVLKHWIRDQEIVASHEGRKTIALDVVSRAIANCVEGAKEVYYDPRYKGLVVSLEPNGAQLFEQLSDGQRIMLTLVGELARRAVTLNPHLGKEAALNTPGVVLIDELDLHLHPKWQRHVIGDLKETFPSLQFITTTHSPQLIGEAKPEEVRVLEDGLTTTPPRSFGIDSSRILREIMGAPSRDPKVEDRLSQIYRLIDDEDFEEANRLLAEVESKLGDSDPDVNRPRALMSFLEVEQ